MEVMNRRKVGGSWSLNGSFASIYPHLQIHWFHPNQCTVIIAVITPLWWQFAAMISYQNSIL
jgi:hypothetical protein